MEEKVSCELYKPTKHHGVYIKTSCSSISRHCRTTSCPIPKIINFTRFFCHLLFVMAFLKSLSLLFMFLICCSLEQPSFASPSVKKLVVQNLSNVLTQLVTVRDTAVDIMKLFRKSKGYYFEHKLCDLATNSMYKYVGLKKDTITGHLGRIYMFLRPLFEATNESTWRDDIKGLQSTLKNVAFGILKPMVWLRITDPRLKNKFPSTVKYNSTLLTEQVQQYLKCVGIPGNKNAERILKYATVIESLDLAMSDIDKDIDYLKRY